MQCLELWRIDQGLGPPIHHVNVAWGELHWPSERMGMVLVLGHITACFVCGWVASASAEDIAIVAVEAGVASGTRSGEKLSEEVHGVLLYTCQLHW